MLFRSCSLFALALANPAFGQQAREAQQEPSESDLPANDPAIGDDNTIVITAKRQNGLSISDFEPELVLTEDDARRMIHEMAQKIAGSWRELLREVGVSGSLAKDYEPAFMHEQSDAALAL